MILGDLLNFGVVLALAQHLIFGRFLILTGPGREFDVYVVHGARDIHPRRSEKLAAFEIEDCDGVKNQFPDFVGAREKLDPARINDFFVEVAQMYIFDIFGARIEGEVPDIFIAKLLGGADEVDKLRQEIELDKVHPKNRAYKSHRGRYNDLINRGRTQKYLVFVWLDELKPKAFQIGDGIGHHIRHEAEDECPAQNVKLRRHPLLQKLGVDAFPDQAREENDCELK